MMPPVMKTVNAAEIGSFMVIGVERQGVQLKILEEGNAAKTEPNHNVLRYWHLKQQT
ncbi:MAG: hypothetical protein R3F23_08280 [Verrucomicrobiia bacterium]